MICIHEPIPPMLVGSTNEIPKQRHLYQLKADGFRCILSYDYQRGVRLYTRNQNECTLQFPELQIKLPVKRAILDGEIVVLQRGKMILEHSLQRLKASSFSEIRKLRNQMSANFVAFDLIYLEEPIHRVPIEKRMDLLRQLDLPEPLFLVPSHENGNELFAATKQLEHEGIVSKQFGSLWRPGIRSNTWLKTKHFGILVMELIAIRSHPFGWLLQDESGQSVCLDRIPKIERLAVHAQFNRLQIPCSGGWIKVPEGIRCEIKHFGHYQSGKLRDPTFHQLVISTRSEGSLTSPR